MTQLTLSDEQTRLLTGATFPILILDSCGRRVAEIASVESTAVDVQTMTDDEWVAEGLRRKERYDREGGRGYTTREVLDHLRSLKPE